MTNAKRLSLVLTWVLALVGFANAAELTFGRTNQFWAGLIGLLVIPLVFTIIGAVLLYKERKEVIARILLAIATIISLLAWMPAGVFIGAGLLISLNKKNKKIGLGLAIVGAIILLILILIGGIDVQY